MERSRFDRLAIVLAESRSRRGVLRVLAVLPLAGLADLLQVEDTLAGRRHRRKTRHRRRKADRQQRRKRNRNQGCNPNSTAQTCAGVCGTVTNNCGKAIDCEPCVCNPPCLACQTCDASNGQCAPDATRLGLACGELNQVCHGLGTCETCDVCASGCAYSSVQAAINAASNGATIHVCAGTFSETITIGESLTLIGTGAGSGGGNTILNGNQNGSVVTVNQGATVTLQGMRIINGDNINGGGIVNSGTLTLTSCTLTQNSADQGGGIYNFAILTLNQTSIENNFATNNQGGGIYNGDGGNLVMNNSQITGNSAGNAGGGLLNNSARATLINSTITNNSVNTSGNPGEGGGIFNVIGTITLDSGSSVTGNNPDNCAGETVAGC